MNILRGNHESEDNNSNFD